MEAPSVLKNKAPGAWCLYMSGTLTSDDIKEAKDLFCMEDDILTVTASPVMPSHYFLNIQRPTNLQGKGSKYQLIVIVRFY